MMYRFCVNESQVIQMTKYNKITGKIKVYFYKVFYLCDSL